MPKGSLPAYIVDCPNANDCSCECDPCIIAREKQQYKLHCKRHGMNCHVNCD